MKTFLKTLNYSLPSKNMVWYFLPYKKFPLSCYIIISDKKEKYFWQAGWVRSGLCLTFYREIKNKCNEAFSNGTRNKKPLLLYLNIFALELCPPEYDVTQIEMQ